MRRFSTSVLPTLLVAVSAAATAALAAEKKAPGKPAEPENQCIVCHGNSDVWDGDQRRLYVTVKDVAGDIHWMKGLRCVDCHGGNAKTEEVNEAHAEQDGFRSLRTLRKDTQSKDYAKPPEPAKVVELCGNCHANIDFMRRYNPSPRVDQLREYWTSGHGQRLKASGDPNVATCVSCHDRPHGSGLDRGKHAIRAVADLESPVYRTHVAETCATKCHADEKLMAGRQYRGRPLGHDQYGQWRSSVHAEALLKKGDLSAPTCNNCHGNHGALPPEVGSVANACGSCHGRVADLFANTVMKHRFEKLQLPGCAQCHGEHEIVKPTDEMLGMGGGAFCAKCHPKGEGEKGEFGGTIAGTKTARSLRADLDHLTDAIQGAKEKVAEAERLGMPLPGPPSDEKLDLGIYLRRASDSLKNARVLIHSFKLPPVEASLAEGLEVTEQVQERAEEALHEYHARRVWLAASLAPILMVIVVLLLYIRSLPPSR
jgi:predicted CXXCH cytochrome family protein